MTVQKQFGSQEWLQKDGVKNRPMPVLTESGKPASTGMSAKELYFQISTGHGRARNHRCWDGLRHIFALCEWLQIL